MIVCSVSWALARVCCGFCRRSLLPLILELLFPSTIIIIFSIFVFWLLVLRAYQCPSTRKKRFDTFKGIELLFFNNEGMNNCNTTITGIRTFNNNLFHVAEAAKRFKFHPFSHCYVSFGENRFMSSKLYCSIQSADGLTYTSRIV